MPRLSLRPYRLLALLVLALAGSAGAAEQAGVSAAVRGRVALARSSAAARPVASGEKIYLADALRSGDASGMQVLLLDETVFTLGANSEIVIDEFVYDPKRGQGRLDAEIVKGVFRFVSGRIAEQRPDDVELRLPSGTIGIRGTIVAGRVEDDGSALVVLLGPGRNANTQDRPGAVRVSAAGRHVDLVQANWATRIPGKGRAPTDPFPLALPDLDELSSALASGTTPPPPPRPERAAELARAAPVPGGEAPAEGSATRWSGQATALGSVFGQKLLSDAVQIASVKQADGIAGQAPIVDSVATVAQLSAISSGAAVYNRPGITFPNGGGFDFGFVVDFGQQQASFGMQNIVSPLLMMPPGNGITLNAIATSFASGNDGKALFSIPTSFGFGPVCNPCNVLVDAAVLNSGGQIAAELAAKVRVSAGANAVTADLGKIPGFFVP
jgi:hypothetical protein